MQAYSLLEMPAQLALLHMNASPAAPRLCPAQLAAAKEAAAASAAVAEEQLRRIYGMPRLDLSSGDTVLQLLGEPAVSCGSDVCRACGACCSEECMLSFRRHLHAP